MRSDHVPIIITINARPEKQLFSGPTRKFAKADWITFRRFIDDKVETTEFNNDDVNHLNSKVTDVIIEAAKNLKQKKTQRSLDDRSHSPSGTTTSRQLSKTGIGLETK